MACRGFFECVLKLLYLVVMAVGLAMVGYGAYLLVMWLQVVPPPAPPLPPSPSPVAVAASGELVRLGRPLLLLVDASALSDGTAKKLSSAWCVRDERSPLLSLSTYKARIFHVFMAHL